LDLPRAGINQYADYFWQIGLHCWIGDAKYKHLSKGQENALRFAQIAEDFEAEELQLIEVSFLWQTGR
jgi:hypothetical protein